MCGVCKNQRALAMGAEIVDFMVQKGHWPPMYKSEDDVLRTEEKLARRLREIQGGLEGTFIEAIRQLGYLPSSPADQMELISRILDEPMDDMVENITDLSLDAAKIGRQMTFDDFVAQGLQASFSDFDRTVMNSLRDKVYTFSKDTASRIKGDFRKTLANGYADGLGIDDVVQNLRSDFQNLRDHRLQTIARTEIQGGQNEGSHATMEEHGIEYEQWLTARDSRVRDEPVASHVILHGEVVRTGEAFSNGLLYPGDRSGIIEEWINCRCRTRPYIPKPDEIITVTPYYP